ESLRRPPRRPVQHRVGVRGAVRGGPGHLQRHAVVQVPGDRAADDRHPDQPVILVSDADGELVADRRLVVAMPHLYEAAGVLEADWDDTQAHDATCQGLTGVATPLMV